MTTRRRHHEGTVRQRPDGTWEARLSLSGGKRKSLYAKTRREVQDKLLACASGHVGLPASRSKAGLPARFTTGNPEQVRAGDPPAMPGTIGKRIAANLYMRKP